MINWGFLPALRIRAGVELLALRKGDSGKESEKRERARKESERERERLGRACGRLSRGIY